MPKDRKFDLGWCVLRREQANVGPSDKTSGCSLFNVREKNHALF